MAWVKIIPEFTALCRERGWDSAAPFLAWAGVLVNHHRYRQVEQVFLSSPPRKRGAGGEGAALSDALAPSPQAPLPQGERGEIFFLKKETRVRWRERFRNAWHGFGWCATSVREAAILQAARSAGVGCPEVVAWGEDERRAFVVTRDENDMIELRTLLPTLTDAEERNRVADGLGHALARLHAAGFDHPDLFAKHILAAPTEAAYRICVLDWARARRRGSLSWRLRCRNLAALDATLHAALASKRLRLRCLRAYLRGLPGAPPLGRLARQIRREAERLRQQRNIREIGQVPTPAWDQQFVPLCDGRLLVVRSFYEQCGGDLPSWLPMLTDAKTQAEDFCLTGAGAASSATLCLRTGPSSAPAWEIPPLAHTLFRLQRFGVKAPRLLATGASSMRTFLLMESAATIPFAEAFAKASPMLRRQMLEQAGQLIRAVHEAGYFLGAQDAWPRRLGVTVHGEDVVLAKVESLQRGSASWQVIAPTELNRQQFRLARTEQLRFLRGYLGKRQAHILSEPERQRRASSGPSLALRLGLVRHEEAA